MHVRRRARGTFLVGTGGDIFGHVHSPFGPRGSMLSRGSSVLGRQRSDSPGADPGSSLSSTAIHSIRVGPALKMLYFPPRVRTPTPHTPSLPPPNPPLPP